MNCFSCRPIVTVSDQAKKLRIHLEKLTYIYATLAIIKLLLGDFNNFLNDILTILMIVLTFIQANYFMAAILIFILLFQTFFLTVTVMLILQNYVFGMLEITSSIQYFYLLLIFATYIVNLMLVYYTFKAYKEYRALFIEQHQTNTYRK